MKKAKSLLAIWLALDLTLTLFPTALAADGNMHTLKWEYDPTHITVNDSATASVTEGTDFTFSFTIASGYEFSALSVAIAGNDDYVTSAPTNSEGTYSYTIAGAELTGDVTISITAAPEASTATEYTVTYDVNGGDALTSSTVQVAVGGSVTLPTPTYADHTFLGWQPEGSTELLAAGAAYTPTTNVTLTAQWAQNVTVTYSQNSDTTSLTGTGYVNQTDYVIEEPNVDAPDGQVFTGWLSSADNTTVYQPGDTITLTADLTLTAQYATEVTISFDSGTNSSTSGIPSDTSGAAGSSYTLPTSEPRRNSGSYEFTGWEYSEDGDVYDAGETVTLPDDGTTAVTFTAKWTYRTYPDYDDDDDDSSSSSSSDDEYTIRATASDGGYVSPSGTTYVDEGDDLTITFAPYSGYVIDGVYIDGVLDNSHDGSYTFRDVDEDHTLYVRYIADTGSGSSGSSGDSDTSPKTGDASAPLRMGLGFGSLALIALLVARRMRRA